MILLYIGFLKSGRFGVKTTFQIQGREAAIIFDKSASEAGRILGPLSGGNARMRDQSDTCKSHIYF